MGEMSSEYKVLVVKLERKRKLGVTIDGYKNNIKMCMNL
jgi:hypothetical protein